MATSLDRQALVAALRAVPGILDADVDSDERGGLGTLRLDLASGVDESVVADRVSRLLQEQFGVGVDEGRVQLVEATDSSDDKDAGTSQVQDLGISQAKEPGFTALEDVEETFVGVMPSPRGHGRPSIAKMHLISSGLDVTASVTLASGDRQAVGEARGLASQSGVHRAVASATLRAVEQLAGGSVRVELEHLEITVMGPERAVVVWLTMLSEKGSEPLTGAAAVRDDVRQAVIRATLDALNRRLELMLVEV